MSVVTTIGRGVAWNTVSTIVAKVVIFANIFIILQHLSVYEYGLSELVMSVVATLNIALLPGLASIIIADLSFEKTRNDLPRMKALFQQYFLFLFILGMLAWASLFFAAPLAAHIMGNPTIESLLRIVSFSFLLAPFSISATLLATVELRYFDQAFYSTAEEIAKGICLLIFFYVFHQGIIGLLLAVVVSQLFAVLLYVPRTMVAYRRLGKETAPDAREFWNVLRSHRKWGIAASYVNSFSQTIQVWVIRLFLGTEAVGLYAFASGVMSHLSSFLPLGSVLSPIIPQYTERRYELVRLLRASLKAQVAIAVFLVVAASAGAPILVLIFPKYRAALPLLYVLFVTVILSAPLAIFGPVFNAFKEQLSFFWSSVIKVITVGVVFLICIPAFGLLGTGIAWAVISIITVFERYIRLCTILPPVFKTWRQAFSLDADERRVLTPLIERLRSKLPKFLFPRTAP